MWVPLYTTTPEAVKSQVGTSSACFRKDLYSGTRTRRKAMTSCWLASTASHRSISMRSMRGSSGRTMHRSGSRSVRSALAPQPIFSRVIRAARPISSRGSPTRRSIGTAICASSTWRALGSTSINPMRFISRCSDTGDLLKDCSPAPRAAGPSFCLAIGQSAAPKPQP